MKHVYSVLVFHNVTCVSMWNVADVSHFLSPGHCELGTSQLFCYYVPVSTSRVWYYMYVRMYVHRSPLSRRQRNSFLNSMKSINCVPVKRDKILYTSTFLIQHNSHKTIRIFMYTVISVKNK